MATEIPFVGKKYNHLLVIELLNEYSSYGDRKILCQCDCGKTRIVMSKSLRAGDAHSCGKCEFCNVYKHGLSYSREFLARKNMIDRCYNENDSGYHNYGGRGITVCDRWLDKENGLINFIEDVGFRPNDSYSLDRIDVNGNYCPENCRWTDQKTQCRNRRNNNTLTLNGITRCLSEWEEITGISRSVFRVRKRYGWSDEDTLTKPVKKIKRKLEK